VSRLATRFAALRNADRKALVTFITAGDPAADATVSALHALVAGGADVLELGVPFSDPEAEGPVIQRSSERALSAGMTLRGALEIVRDFRRADAATPIVLMGYLNPIERFGYREFVAVAASAGVDGLIIVNLPPEAADEMRQAMHPHELDLIFLVAPTTTADRIALITARAAGFVYYVSLKGVTGADHLRLDGIAGQVARIRRETDLPVLVGFGIKDAAAARRVAQVADGVVIGSALVDTMERLGDDRAAMCTALQAQARELRLAIDSTQ
jgi:tryptophan synthase alpha chain